MNVPPPITVKLMNGGWRFDQLPKARNDINDWQNVQNDCQLTNPELCELKNIRCPLTVGTSTETIIAIDQNGPLGWERVITRRRSVVEQPVQAKDRVREAEQTKNIQWKESCQNNYDSSPVSTDENKKEMLCETVRGGEAKMNDLIKLLADEQVDINWYLNDEHHSTVLIYTCRQEAAWNHSGLALLLLNAGANVDIKDRDGNTALIFASYNDHPEVVKFLLDAEADPNLQNKKLWTALMSAAWSNRKEIVRLLVNAGADKSIRNEEGNTALSLARMRQYGDIELLLE